jgi:putative transposase
MISASDRGKAIELIDEAVISGARLFKACNELEITERTYYRWINLNKINGSYADRRPFAERPEPKNKLTPEERQLIIDTVNQGKFASQPPAEIIPALADQGIYIASESTFYRVLKENNMQHHRGRTREPLCRLISTHAATGPNQVWMWDITYLNGPIKGIFYYLYLITDLYSRDIVGWEVWEEESSEHASELIKRTTLSQRVLTTDPLILHSDNGSPMKGATMLSTLYQLGITPSNSRPRVSNDNPYAESIFKTLKYRPNYQPKGFNSLSEARLWCSNFVNWYRFEHHHSGLKFLTPAQRHHGEGDRILAKRRELYEKAKASHPERWNGRKTRDWSLPETVYLNPEKKMEKNTINDANQKAVS